MKVWLLITIGLLTSYCAPPERISGGIISTDSGDESDDLILPDADHDGVPVSQDCDDNNPDRFPGNADSLDGVDRNCAIDVSACSAAHPENGSGTTCAGFVTTYSNELITNTYCVTAEIHPGPNLDPFIDASVEIRIRRIILDTSIYPSRFMYEYYPDYPYSDCGPPGTWQNYDGFDGDEELVFSAPFGQSKSICDFRDNISGDPHYTRLVGVDTSLKQTLEVKQGMFTAGYIWTYYSYELSCEMGD